MGDDLVRYTAGQALSARNDTYMYNMFETSIYASSNDDNAARNSNNPRYNPISKLINNFARALNENKKIPKWVVVVPESDYLNSANNYTQFGISEAYGILIEYAMSTMDKMIEDLMGDNLPHKANKYNWPYFLWIEPTLHMKYANNNLRGNFSKSLHIASLMHDRVIVLPLRQMWSDSSPNIFDVSQNRLTFPGLSTFWKGVDQAVRFADTKLLRNFGVSIRQVFNKPKFQKESEEVFENFEKRLAARRDLTKQLQMNQVVRFFNNQMQRLDNPRTRGQPGLGQQGRTAENGRGGQNNNNNTEPTEPRNGNNRHRHHKSTCRKQLFKKK